MSRTLFILHYPPPLHGAAMMGQYIKESELINKNINAKYINLGTSITVDEIGKSGYKKWFRYFKLLCKTFFYGLFWRPKLVYITLSSHGNGLVKDSVVVAICRVLNLKHVFHFHNKGVKKYGSSKLGAFLYPYVFKKASVILLSPLLYEDIAAYVPKSRVYYCANGIPKITINDTKTFINKPKNKPLHLLFLSNLIVSKGVWEVLEACRLLHNNNLDFHCTLAGGIGDVTAEEVESFILKNQLSQKVAYIGKVAGKTKIKALETADVFLHPTIEDCFPLVLLEAMQFGLPIISTNEGAIPEIVQEGKNGFIIEKNDVKTLVKVIKQYITNYDLIALHGANNLLKYKENYTSNTFEKRFCLVLGEIN